MRRRRGRSSTTAVVGGISLRIEVQVPGLERLVNLLLQQQQQQQQVALTAPRGPLRGPDGRFLPRDGGGGGGLVGGAVTPSGCSALGTPGAARRQRCGRCSQCKALLPARATRGPCDLWSCDPAQAAQAAEAAAAAKAEKEAAKAEKEAARAERAKNQEAKEAREARAAAKAAAKRVERPSGGGRRGGGQGGPRKGGGRLLCGEAPPGLGQGGG